MQSKQACWDYLKATLVSECVLGAGWVHQGPRGRSGRLPSDRQWRAEKEGKMVTFDVSSSCLGSLSATGVRGRVDTERLGHGGMAQ